MSKLTKAPRMPLGLYLLRTWRENRHLSHRVRRGSRCRRLLWRYRFVAGIMAGWAKRS